MAEFYYDLITVLICYILFWSIIIGLILYIKIKRKNMEQRINIGERVLRIWHEFEEK